MGMTLSAGGRWRRRMLVGVVAGGLVCAPALARAAEPAEGVEVTRSIGAPLTVSGQGCLLGDEPRHVELGLNPVDVVEEVGLLDGQGSVGADGSWTITVVIPEHWEFSGRQQDFTEGTYNVVVLCRSASTYLFTNLHGDVGIVHVEDRVGDAPTTVDVPTTGSVVTEPQRSDSARPVPATPRFTG